MWLTLEPIVNSYSYVYLVDADDRTYFVVEIDGLISGPNRDHQRAFPSLQKLMAGWLTGQERFCTWHQSCRGLGRSVTGGGPIWDGGGVRGLRFLQRLDEIG